MTDTPLVSVVLPAFNAAAFVGAAIESVLRQTYSHMEIIVVDDGSQDDTLAIVSRAAASDPRVRVVAQANRGVAAARNAAIALARGEFIAPIDADDLWDPTKLERQVACMRESGPQTGLVYCWWLWLDAQGEVQDVSPKWRVQGEVLEQLIEINFVGCASIPLFRRTCVEEVGRYNVRLREGCEDWELSIKIAERYRVGVAPAFLVGYRRSANSMSTSVEKMARSRAAVIDECQRRQPAIAPSVFRQSRRQFGFYLAGVSLWSRSYARAFRWAVTVPPGVAFAAAPHVFRAVVTRGAARLRNTPRKPLDGTGFSAYEGPASIIPFEEIYDRRWARRSHGRISNR